MTSQTEVVNSAMRLIGAGRISSLTDGQPQSNAANDIYDDLLDDLLRSHPWNFATKRAALTQLTTAPTFGFDHAYTVPADWLRTVSVSQDSDGRTTAFYKEELVDNKRVLVTDADELYMRYVARIVDPNLWSADFRRAFISSLARDLAVPAAASNKLQDTHTKGARRDLSRAKSADAMGSSPEQRPRGSWVLNRGGGRHRAEPGTVD